MLHRRRRSLARLLHCVYCSQYNSIVVPLLVLFQLRLMANYYLQLEVQENPLFSQKPRNISCAEEKMSYSWKIRDSATGKLHSGKGRSFDCRLVEFLHKFDLSDQSSMPKNFKAKPPGRRDGPVFVTASNVRFYQSLRGVLATIKRTFGRQQRIIVYDLGGIVKNRVMMHELDQLCNVEIRQLDFSLLPRDVRGMKTFSWKVLILAQSFAEHDLFIYCDTSVHFINANYEKHFDLINEGKISPFLFMQGTYHGIKHATLAETFDYLPLFTSNQFDVEMQEANFIVVKKSEFARQILKWALLCALTRACIEPRKVKWDCPETIFHTNRQFGLCHRMDQSAMSILIHNAEAELASQGNPQLIRHFDYNHPSHRLINHILVREQSTPEKIGQLYRC